MWKILNVNLPFFKESTRTSACYDDFIDSLAHSVGELWPIGGLIFARGQTPDLINVLCNRDLSNPTLWWRKHLQLSLKSSSDCFWKPLQDLRGFGPREQLLNFSPKQLLLSLRSYCAEWNKKEVVFFQLYISTGLAETVLFTFTSSDCRLMPEWSSSFTCWR